MFYLCQSLTEIDLSGFNTSNITDMRYMFGGCYDLTTILVGDGWITDNVTTSTNMFAGCTQLVGGNGTIYDSAHTDKTYARVDEAIYDEITGEYIEGNKGYFTFKQN